MTDIPVNALAEYVEMLAEAFAADDSVDHADVPLAERRRLVKLLAGIDVPCGVDVACEV